jgi:6-phosphogluconolactonase
VKTSQKPLIEVHARPSDLAEAATEHFITLAEHAVAQRGRFAVALSGGATPRATYEELARVSVPRQVDWEHIHVFWGDERCVAPSHADSNYRMAREALLKQVSVPSQNIHRIRGEIGPAEAAREYEEELRKFFAGPARHGKPGATPQWPRFDLILLGLGKNGHTASLFPGTAALDERRRWVAANHVDDIGAWRITLTLPVINSAADVLFIVSGTEKAEVVSTVLGGKRRRSPLPAQMIEPANGRLLWLLDEDAASRLEPSPY